MPSGEDRLRLAPGSDLPPSARISASKTALEFGCTHGFGRGLDLWRQNSVPPDEDALPVLAAQPI